MLFRELGWCSPGLIDDYSYYLASGELRGISHQKSKKSFLLISNIISDRFILLLSVVLLDNKHICPQSINNIVRKNPTF